MRKLIIPIIGVLVVTFIITGCGTSTQIPIAPVVTQTNTTIANTAAATAPALTRPAITAPAIASPVGAIAPAATTAAKYGGILRDIEAGGPGSPIGMPGEVAGAAGMTAQISTDQLLHEDYKGNILPNLATSYDVVTDPSNASITFHLRQGVKFQDGTDFNAQAVKWNLNMIKTGGNSSTTAVWKSIDTLDDYTVRVSLTAWQNVVVRNFCGLGQLLVSPTAYQKNGVDWMRYHMVGTGAFQQVSYVPDVGLTTAKYSGYWEQGKPYLDGVTLLYVADPMTRLALFKSGGAEIMPVQPNDASTLQKAGYSILNNRQGRTCWCLIA